MTVKSLLSILTVLLFLLSEVEAGEVKDFILNYAQNSGYFEYIIRTNGECTPIALTQSGKNIKIKLINCSYNNRENLHPQIDWVKNIQIEGNANTTDVKINLAKTGTLNIEKDKNFIKLTISKNRSIVRIIEKQISEGTQRIEVLFPNNLIPEIKKRKNKLIIQFPVPLTFKNSSLPSNVTVLNSSTLYVTIPHNSSIEIRKENSRLIIVIYQKHSNKTATLALKFINADIKAVATAISEVVGVNIVVDPEVKGEVTIDFQKPVDWKKALNAVLLPLGAKLIEKDTYWYITPISKLKREEYKHLETRVFELKYAEAEEVAKKIGRMLNMLVIMEGENIENSTNTSTTGQNGTSENTQFTSLESEISYIKEKEIFANKQIITSPDIETTPDQSSLEDLVDNTNPNRSKKERKLSLSFIESITYVKTTNQIIVRATPEKINEVSKIISELDKPRKQIFVKAKIIQISSNAEKELGLSWFLQGYNRLNNEKSAYISSSFGFNIDNYQQLITPETYGNLFSIPTSESTFALGILNSAQTFKVELAIKALELEGNAQVISTPQVLTFENRTAIIEQGIEIPYTETTTQPSGATENTVNFKKASLILMVKPRAVKNNQVLLEITLKKDNPNYSYLSITGSNQPAIDTRTVFSQVQIKSGDTIVIGGIIEKEKHKNIHRVPILSQIPLLKWLFRSESIQSSKNQLLIMITPQIINNSGF